MKALSLALVSALLAATTVQAAPPPPAADISWYDPIHNVTCTGHAADGRITCQPGQVDAPLQVSPASLSPSSSLPL
jgi:hypothetical protein